MPATLSYRGFRVRVGRKHDALAPGERGAVPEQKSRTMDDNLREIPVTLDSFSRSAHRCPQDLLLNLSTAPICSASGFARRFWSVPELYPNGSMITGLFPPSDLPLHLGGNEAF